MTIAIVSFVKSAWPRGPEPWTTWGIAEITVFVGGFLKGAFTLREAVLLFFSGIIVAATALGSRSGVQLLIDRPSGGSKS